MASVPLVSTPRRVLMTADAVGGVWDYALELVRGLGTAGVEVVLAVMGPPPDEAQLAAAAALPNVELCLSDHRLEWMEDPWDDVAAAGGWLLALADRRRIDLVHLNGYAHAVLPFGRPVLVVAHSCVISWWHAVKKEAPPPSWERYRRAVAAGLQAAARIVAPTAWMMRALQLHHGPLPTGHVIPNGRRAASYHAGPKEPFILSVGRLWDEAKNVGLLARVAPRLPMGVKVVGAPRPVAGVGGPGLSAEALEKVDCLGRLSTSALAALYARASIYALPARYEPFGLSVLEAALAGCALVLGDIGSLRELWDGAALFVDPDDEAAFAATLGALARRPDRVARLGALARERAARLGAEKMVERYLALYRFLDPDPHSLIPEEEAPLTCAS